MPNSSLFYTNNKQRTVFAWPFHSQKWHIQILLYNARRFQKMQIHGVPLRAEKVINKYNKSVT